MSDENFEFEAVAAGASLTYPMEAGALRKNGHCMLKGKPCRIAFLGENFRLLSKDHATAESSAVVRFISVVSLVVSGFGDHGIDGYWCGRAATSMKRIPERGPRDNRSVEK